MHLADDNSFPALCFPMRMGLNSVLSGREKTIGQLKIASDAFSMIRVTCNYNGIQRETVFPLRIANLTQNWRDRQT